jgi:dTDP-glucose 4,6-dehydratase
MRSVLVTGGAGFIGSNFIRFLYHERRRVRITVVDKLTYAGNVENLRDFVGRSDFRFVHGDICDASLLDRLVPGVDVIYNFAAETHVDRSIMEGTSFVRTDVLGTFTLLQRALKYEIPRFVQVSTDEVYGSIARGSFRERDPLLPNSPYSASKSGADLLVRSFFKTYGLPAVITRSSNNYGPFQHPEKFIPLFITNALERKPLPLYGDGRNVRDWIYVEDNCRAIELVGRAGAAGEIYNVGAGEERSNVEIARMIIDLTGAPKELLTFISDRPGHDRRYALDAAKVRRLGWRATVPFEEGLERTVRWYRKNDDWWRPIKAGKFKRYYAKLYRNRIAEASRRKETR